MRGCATLKRFAGGARDGVVNDVGRRAADAAGFADLGLLFDLGLMAGSQSYDFAEELFIDLAEYVRHRLTAHG